MTGERMRSAIVDGLSKERQGKVAARPSSGPGRQQGRKEKKKREASVKLDLEKAGASSPLLASARSAASLESQIMARRHERGERKKSNGNPESGDGDTFLTDVDAGGMGVQQRILQVSSEQSKLREELEAYMETVRNRVSESDGTLLLDFGGEGEFEKTVEEQESTWNVRTGRRREGDKLRLEIEKIERMDSKLERLEKYAQEVWRETAALLGEEASARPKRKIPREKKRGKSLRTALKKEGGEDDASSVTSGRSRASTSPTLLPGQIDFVKRNRELAATAGSLTPAEEARLAAMMGDAVGAGDVNGNEVASISESRNAFAPTPSEACQMESIAEALQRCKGPIQEDISSVVKEALECARAHVDVLGKNAGNNDALSAAHIKRSEGLTMQEIDLALDAVSAGSAYDASGSSCEIHADEVRRVVKKTISEWGGDGSDPSLASTAQVDLLLKDMGVRPRSAPLIESVMRVKRPHQQHERDLDFSRGRLLPAKRRMQLKSSS